MSCWVGSRTWLLPVGGNAGIQETATAEKIYRWNHLLSPQGGRCFLGVYIESNGLFHGHDLVVRIRLDETYRHVYSDERKRFKIYL